MKVLFDHMSLTGCVVLFSPITLKPQRTWLGGVKERRTTHLCRTSSFNAMITGDKNLSYQQNLTHPKLGLIVLETNDWNAIKLDASPCSKL